MFGQRGQLSNISPPSTFKWGIRPELPRDSAGTPPVNPLPPSPRGSKPQAPWTATSLRFGRRCQLDACVEIAVDQFGNQPAHRSSTSSFAPGTDHSQKVGDIDGGILIEIARADIASPPFIENDQEILDTDAAIAVEVTRGETRETNDIE